jgi:hypothetical protein
MNRVHISSDDLDGNAQKHAEDGDHVEHVNSLSELRELFNGWIKTGESLDYLDFHAHGGPAYISLRSDNLGLHNIDGLISWGFAQIFNNKAKIVFHGCNVAESYKGEYFLLRFARIALKKRGGTVLGSNGLGIAHRLDFSGEIYHPFGSWVSVGVSSGGAARLHGQLHLVPVKLQERVQATLVKYATLEAEGLLSAPEAGKIKKMLDRAIGYAALPDDDNMANAYDHLELVERALYQKWMYREHRRQIIPRATTKL